MSDKTVETVLTVAVLILAVLGVFVYLVGESRGQAAERAAAIEAGVARWAVDPKTGEVRFLYVRCDGEEIGR